jgi:trk system potassium uptake protein TrkH
MALVIIGGLGFTVWDDIVQNIKNKRKLNHLNVHTKIVLLVTTILLLSGTILILIFECNNIYTMKNDNIGIKILKAAFQSYSSIKLWSTPSLV